MYFLNFCQWPHFMYKYMKKKNMNKVFYKYYTVTDFQIFHQEIFFSMSEDQVQHIYFLQITTSLVKLLKLNKKTPSFMHQLQTKFSFTIRKNLIINKLKSSASSEQFPNTVIGISFWNDAWFSQLLETRKRCFSFFWMGPYFRDTGDNPLIFKEPLACRKQLQPLSTWFKIDAINDI